MAWTKRDFKQYSSNVAFQTILDLSSMIQAWPEIA